MKAPVGSTRVGSGARNAREQVQWTCESEQRPASLASLMTATLPLGHGARFSRLTPFAKKT